MELHISEEESELSKAKKTVWDLTSRIEQSNFKAKLRMKELEKLKHRKQGQEERALTVKNIHSFANYAEVMRELEKVKQDLSKLKLEMKRVLEEKNQVENEAKGFNVIIDTYTKSVDALRQEIEEVNDEQILVELTEIEASKELADIEAQRELEAQKFLSEIENTKRKTKEILEEIDRSKELEKKLTLMKIDIEMLENQIKTFKEMDIRVSSFRKGKKINSSKSVMEELELAKKELGSIREEGFQLMASMDVIRNELIHVSEKTARLKKKDEKAEQNVHNLNSKLLKAKTKLEAVSSSEEKAKTIVENLFLTCEHLKMEIEASKMKRELIYEETVKIKAQNERNEAEIELAEMKLEAALQELEGVKSLELVALENLKILTEKIMIDRAFRSKDSSKITISKFEYEYLKSHAAEAEEVADKKVLAAQAWIKALKANEEEIRIETEIAERKMREKREEEDMERLLREKLMPSWDENSEVENSEFGGEIRRKSMKNSGSPSPTPVRRTKVRISTSPGFRYTSRSSNVNIKRREKLMPNLGKLFNSKAVENEK